MNNHIIGILAGMGPRSTAPFIDLVIDECQAQYNAKYDEEFPHILIYSLPTPFYVDRPIDHALMRSIIKNGLQKLQSAGAEFVAMPCNSAHIYYEELKASIDVPLLNIVSETVKSLQGDGKGITAESRTTLFSTVGTFESGIYQQGIRAAGHDFIFKEGWQEKLNTLISGIKADKADRSNLDLWKALLMEAEREELDTIIVACTDLNVVTKQVESGISIVDSSKCLAGSVVREYLRLCGRGQVIPVHTGNDSEKMQK